MTRRLCRLLLPLAGIPLLLVFASPAWAGWTTLHGGDPVQFDQVCHDGISWDWARYSMSADQIDADTKIDTLIRQALDPFVQVPIYPDQPANDEYPEGPAADPMMTVSTSVPYRPTSVPGFDDPGSVHLLEGHLGVHFPDVWWQPTGAKIWPGGMLDVTVQDCYLYAPVRALAAPSPFVTTVALLGTSHMSVARLNPANFRLRATGTIALSPPAPETSSTRDVNGDGLPDLVLTFGNAGTGITSTTTSLTLTGRTVHDGLLTGQAALR